ncbi:MAG: DUF1631 family protein [Rubrivivax sp.]|nr:DUF1631 family protein [Rubrivivax sp.]
MTTSRAAKLALQPPPLPPQLADFVQTLRQDLHTWLPRALDAAATTLEQSMAVSSAPAIRVTQSELWARLAAQRVAWIEISAQAIGHAIDEELQGQQQPAPARADEEQPLTLLAEDSIDEEIALSRLVQTAEIEADATLRELAARCARLRGWPAVQPDAHPMRPAVVARGLREAVTALGLDTQSRLELLRHLAPAIGHQMAALYARQLSLLNQWGVEPERFGPHVRAPNQPVPRAGADLGHGSDLHEGPLSTAVISTPSATEATHRLAQNALQRLAPSGVGAAAGGIDPVQTMTRLLAALLDRVGPSLNLRRALQRLDEPAKRLARSEPQLWQSPDHPLWLLLDRLMCSGALLDEADLDGHTQPGTLLDAALDCFAQSDPPDAGQLRAALDAVDHAAHTRLDAHAQRLAPQAQAMQAHLARGEVEARVREQIVQKLRGHSGTPAALRQFLLGPWAAALAASAMQHGLDSPRFAMQADLIDTLVQVCTRPRNRPLDAAVFTRCSVHARLALADSGLPPARVEAELADLEHTLRRPWSDARQHLPSFDEAAPEARRLDIDGAPTPQDPLHDEAAAAPTPQPAAAPAAEAHDPLALHDALATVPLDMAPNAQARERAEAACDAWVGTLEPGTLCRLFLQGRWTTLQVVWRSLDRSMIALAGRPAGVNHTMTRAALHKLRAAGLATSIERGQLIAHALNELAEAA